MAKREINWTSKALSDRTNILEYWYERTGSVDYPLKLKNLFSSTITLFAKLSESGMVFDSKRNIRYVIVKYYRIYFTYTDSDFTVLSIWDTRRNQKNFEL